MSKPLAAKGVGACLKRVLNTRLRLVSPRHWSGGIHAAGFSSGRREQSLRRRERPPQAMKLNLHPRVEGTDRLNDRDPLPPEDRVIEPRAKLSLDQIYRARAPSLIRFFSRRAPADEAQDLMHETFTRLLNTDTRGDHEVARPDAYLSRIARNLLRDRAKTRARRSADLHVSDEEFELTAPNQLQALEARDLLNRLEEAVLRLPPKTREIFLAHRLDGFSYAEIAVRTGITVKGVEKHMSRAIAYLDRNVRAR